MDDKDKNLVLWFSVMPLVVATGMYKLFGFNYLFFVATIFAVLVAVIVVTKFLSKSGSGLK